MIEVKINAIMVGDIQPLGDREVLSGIDKRPVDGVRQFQTMGFVGDHQADLKHHGGVEKAIHHYPFEHYDHWSSVFAKEGVSIYPQTFHKTGFVGENISTQGVQESDVCLGDIFQLGSGVVQISQGRQPCWKLNERFGFKKMARYVQTHGKTGWYYRVLEPGEVVAGDILKLIERPAQAWPLSRVIELLYQKTSDLQALKELERLPFLAESWRELMQRRLDRGVVEDWKSRLEG